MMEIAVDVAVVGSGFGGSLTALILNRIGLRPVLIDRCTHPRFAIGESSTPMAGFVLRALARNYNLPRLEPLSKFGTWRAVYPELACGLKRGFSYFPQLPDQRFVSRADHANELLVAASSDNEHSDTHWLRADVDRFLVQEVCAAGIPYFDQTSVSLEPVDGSWNLAGVRQGRPIRIASQFVVDASGEAGVVARTLGIPDRADELRTHSRAIFSHFSGVKNWHDGLAANGGRVDDHPFLCDHSALHHVLDEGWMWQLRFHHGVTSAGLVIDSRDHPLDDSQSPEQEWHGLLQRYPSVFEQFEQARLVEPPGRLLRTGRLQRIAARIVGENWVMLPNTAGFIDPLHSTGIAHTLCGVERLAQILGGHWGKSTLTDRLLQYEKSFVTELTLIDKLVSGCYLARKDWRLFMAFCMLYFAAATTNEYRRSSGISPAGSAFLCADDPIFCQCVDDLWRLLQRLVRDGPVSELQVAHFEGQVADAIRPYNRVGLCDPSVHNLYRHTAADDREYHRA